DNNYMLVWQKRSYTLYRVDMNTFDVLAVKINKPMSGSVTGSAAISGSGRYASVAIESPTYADLLLIDYESCKHDVKEYVTNGIECKVSSFKNQLKTAIGENPYPRFPRFYGEHTLGVYHRPNGSTGN